MKTEIENEKLAEALITASEMKKRRHFDKETIVWCHLLRAELHRAEYECPENYSITIQYLFRVMNSRTIRWKFQQGMRNLSTDEVPTQWMRDLYKKFKTWQDTPDAKRHTRNFAYMNDKGREVEGGEKFYKPTRVPDSGKKNNTKTTKKLKRRNKRG